MSFQSVSNSVYSSKYQLFDKHGNEIDENRSHSFMRVAHALAKNEKDVQYWANSFFEAMCNGAIPAGRIMGNAGAEEHKPNTSLMNCTVSDTIYDHIEGIGQSVKESLVTLSGGSGIGYEFSTLRPRGSYVNGVKAQTSGPLPFADIFDKGCFTIASAGGRRGAQMATFDLRHPDVLAFIKAKREDGRFRQFNISVLVSHSFFNDEKDWIFRFPIRNSDPALDTAETMWDTWHVKDDAYITNEHGQTLFKIYGKIPKTELWDLILKSNYDYAEPGIIFVDRFNEENNLWFCEELRASNPCVVGDTKIAVAGKGAIEIKKLADAGVDVPVFCQNLSTGKVEVSMGRNPRKTGEQHAVYEVLLDDGTSFKANAEHKLFLRNNESIKVKDLKIGDSLIPFKATKNEKQDTRVKSTDDWMLEQHLMLNYKYGVTFKFGTGKGYYHAHHIDGVHANNTLENLEALLHEQHSSLHLLKKNPMKDWWNEQDESVRNAYRQKMSNSVAGDKNGMYGKMHTEETKLKIGITTKERFNDASFVQKHKEAVNKTQTEAWRKQISETKTKPREIVKGFCDACSTPFEYERIIGSTYLKSFCSAACRAYNASCYAVQNEMSAEQKLKISIGSKSFANSIKGKQAKRAAGLKSMQQRALKCGSFLLSKGLKFSKASWDSLIGELHNGGIKPTVTASKIDEYWIGDWNKFEEDCNDFNHKVLSVKFVGYEDVYNITVDTHHNYFIVTNEWETATGSNFSGILSRNCGEVPLPPNGSCLLGSIDLTRFVDRPFTDDACFDFEEFTNTVNVFTRMLDNVVEFNNLPLQAQQEEITRKRRHGMGFFGLGSALILLGIRYDSPQALEFAEKVTKLMAIRGYITGCLLAEEKGSAPVLDEYFEITPEIVRKNDLFKDRLGQKVKGIELFLASPYMQRLLAEEPTLKKLLLQCGSRFSHHTSIAPTGTISLAFGNNASGGIEPSFSHCYFRNLTVEGKKTRQQEAVYSKEFLLYKELYGQNKTDEELLKHLPDYFVTADTISWKAHVDMVAVVQKWVDASISKTCNVPTEITFEEFEGVYRYAYQAGCKAVSTFRYNPETLGSILSRSEDLAKSRYEFKLADGTVIQCAGGDRVEYDGEVTTAENLFSALKENTYGKF